LRFTAYAVSRPPAERDLPSPPNIRDMVSKGSGRPRRGELHPRAKLTADEV